LPQRVSVEQIVPVDQHSFGTSPRAGHETGKAGSAHSLVMPPSPVGVNTHRISEQTNCASGVVHE
jgi:hypothetical protein